jgi:GNAT superfamily N-acetyltransferase
MTTKPQKAGPRDKNRMANSSKKQTQGDAMNIPPGIDRIQISDGSYRYRVRIRIKGHKPVSKNFKTLDHAKRWKRVTEGQIEKGLYVSFSKADQYTVADYKEEGGEILSHVGFLEYPMLIEGKWHKAGALHAICTKLTHRGRGLASQLIQEVLNWAKTQYEFIVLFTEIPKFYENLSFQYIQEYRFRLACKRARGTKSLQPLTFSEDNDLFLRCFSIRQPVSNRLWVKDNGTIASFNTLFATYPTYWSLHYSPTLNAIVSYLLEDKTLHLFEIVASEVPSLDLILDHIPAAIDEIYFYFSPDLLTNAAIAEPVSYEKKNIDFSGYLMVRGNWPSISNPFMISPLSRC